MFVFFCLFGCSLVCVFVFVYVLRSFERYRQQTITEKNANYLFFSLFTTITTKFVCLYENFIIAY